MKTLIILFLLVAQIAIAQTNRFDRKLKRAVNHQKEKVFICEIPDKDFESGTYQISKKNTSSELVKRYLVFKDNTVVANIEVYNYDIIKIIPTQKE